MPTLFDRLIDRARWEWREYRTPSRPAFVQEEIDEALLGHVEWRAAERVLDVGCARGRYMTELARRGVDPIGLDLDSAALQKARREHLAVTLGSGQALPFADGVFETILCHKSMDLFPDPYVAVAEKVTKETPSRRR
jgi:SAM-dependent methyltransferase